MREAQILAQAREAFMLESRDLLVQLESALVELNDGAGAESDAVAAAFRAAHTIKGSAGLFGMEAVVGFTHEVETVLDQLRSGKLEVSDPLVTLLLEGRDQIERLLDAAVDSDAARLADEGTDIDRSAECQRLVELLQRASGRTVAPAADVVATGPAGTACVQGDWLVDLRFGSALFGLGFDPLSFLRYLPTAGDVQATEAYLDDIPPLDRLDPESCHLGLALRLKGAADKRSIESVFDFISDSIDLRIVPPQRKVDEMRALLDAHSDDDTRLGELLVRIGALTERELHKALAEQRLAADQAAGTAADPVDAPVQRLGEQLVERRVAPAELVKATVERQQHLRERKSDESRFVRVQSDKLDALISLIGELVIAGSATQILSARHGDAQLTESSARLGALVEAARDRALQLRMVPIGETFARFKRIAHEVGKTLGKEVDFSVTGGEAELDKSMVDLIVDPLTHLVRNALDHGLETPEQRVAAGKPPRGRLALHAYHESGSIVIETSDDGRGLSRERILARAIERGMVDGSTEMSDAEVYQLIFQPGFSTAEQVTSLSGRGVGMDVVRRNIEALRGEVSLHSRPGLGSTVRIRLPLTLAIIDGFRFEVAGQSFVVPLDGVVECIENPCAADLQGSGGADGCFRLRGEVLPMLCLRTHLGLDGAEAAQRSVLIMRGGAAKVGVVVDRLLGEHQTVIKPLGRLFRRLRGISGSTILGTGTVALILDMPALIAMAEPAASAGARRPVPPPDFPPRRAEAAATLPS